MRPLKLSYLATTGLSLALLSTAAHAQTQSDSDDIVVTGTRQAYQGDFAPLEVPQSNTTLDRELLLDAGVLNLDDALDLSASVSRQNNFGGLWNSFAIRGFAGDINLPGGYLLNGFNAGRGFSGPRDLAAIESVDILKGPRSALFGRGEPAGTVNLVTKRPTFDTGGYVKGTVGSWNEYRAEADLQHSVSGDGGDLGVRLVGFYEDAESFREGVETKKLGFYPSATLNFGETVTATYEFEYTDQELPQDRGVVFSEEFGFSPRDVFVGEDVPIDTKVLGHQLEAEFQIDENWSLLTGAGYRETSLVGGAFEPQFGSRQTFNLDGQTISRFFRFRDFESDYLTLRAEVAGEFDTGGLRHRVIFGADYDEFDNTLFITRDRPNPRGDFLGDGRGPSEATPEEAADFLLLDVLNPVLGNVLTNGIVPNTNRNEVLSGYGFYIQDQIDITDKLQIRLGGRFDDFEQDLTQLGGTTLDTRTLSDSRFSPQVGAVYSVNDGFSVYATYGEGFRQQGGVDFFGNQFDPNLTESIEGGFKADLGHFFDGIDGSATVAIFQVDQGNILVNDTREGVEGFSSFPAGEARSTGVEFDAYASFANDINFWFSYAYTDAEFRNSFADFDGFGFTIEPGDPLINAPQHQLNLQLSKGFEFGDISAELGGGLLYVDDQNGFVGSDFTLPSYTTVRLFGEIEPVENISLRLNVDNLFDETFYTNSFADVWVQPGAPRRFRVSAAYSF